VRTCLAREFAFLGREATIARWAWNRGMPPAVIFMTPPFSTALVWAGALVV
jgi:hypothetical protein